MAEQLTDKGAIITGGASGIGRATAALLGSEGAAVCIFDRDKEAGQRVLKELEGVGTPRASFIEVDLADPSAIAPAVEKGIEFLGRVDILVNSAGVRGTDPAKGRSGLFDIDLETWNFVQAVNLRAPFLMTQAVARHMVDTGGGGRIVNLSSMAAFQAANCSMHYAASKAGLSSLTRTAASDLGRHGINVNAVAPGITRTPMLGVSHDDEYLRQRAREGPTSNLLGTLSEPEEVATVILFLCLPASSQITAQTIHTSAGTIV
jgi:NAD(P)-dependent dehydrogenase (short-subunit alcohol dehydrogenase family)